jgi:A/G-specific adenine glycosylase
VPAGAGWAWNQALIDLGVAHCRARQPDCHGCPLAGGCAWRRAGCPDPDPARGSAATASPQAPFEGSDRQGRGRLVAALRSGPIAAENVAEVMGWPQDRSRVERVAQRLVADGLVERRGERYELPA